VRFESQVDPLIGQHDVGRTTSPTANHGDIFKHDAIRSGVQHVKQDYRTDSESMRHIALHETERQTALEAPNGSLRRGKGAIFVKESP
jgi:hypothetical protein